MYRSTSNRLEVLPPHTPNVSLVNDKSEDALAAFVTDTPPTDVRVVPTWLRDPDPIFIV